MKDTELTPTEHTETAAAELKVIALDKCSWRVSDRELEPADARCVLAYVERRSGGRFSVLMLAPRPGVHAEYSTMEEALTAIAAQRPVVNEQAGMERSNGALGQRRAS